MIQVKNVIVKNVIASKAKQSMLWACPPLRVGRAFRSSLPLGLLTTVVSTSPSTSLGPLNHRRCGGLLRNCSMPSRCKLAGGPSC